MKKLLGCLLALCMLFAAVSAPVAAMTQDELLQRVQETIYGTPEPTQAPTPTPAPTQEPDPTQTPSGGEEGQDPGSGETEATPSPSPTPEPDDERVTVGYGTVGGGSPGYSSPSEDSLNGYFEYGCTVYAARQGNGWTKVAFVRSESGSRTVLFVPSGWVSMMTAKNVAVLRATLAVSGAPSYNGYGLPTASYTYDSSPDVTPAPEPQTPTPEPTVTPAPHEGMTVTVSRSTAMAEEGEEVFFSVSVSGAEGELSYQWQRSPDAVSWFNTVLPGNNTPVLHFEATQARLSNYYRCAVTDDHGTVYSAPAKITWIDPSPDDPAVYIYTSTPIAQSGETVIFTGYYTGMSDSASCQWQRSADLVSWTDTSLPGNTTDQLRFQATRARLAYYYRLVVTDASTVLVSDPAQISWMEASVIIKASPSVVPLGTQAVFKATVTGTEGEVTYQWQRSKSRTGTFTNTNLGGNKTSRLYFTATAERLGYYYRCVVTDQNGVYVSQAIRAQWSQVTVDAYLITDEQVREGDPVVFQADVTGLYSGYTFQWERSPDGWAWGPASLPGSNTDTLQFTATEARCRYYYRCSVSYNGLTVYSDPVWVVYNALPEILTQPADFTAASGLGARFTLTAAGADSYQWQVYDTTLGEWTDLSDTEGEGGTAGSTTASLTLTARGAMNGSLYRCLVSNRYGTVASSPAVLTVSAASGFYISGAEVTGTTVTVTWTPLHSSLTYQLELYDAAGTLVREIPDIHGTTYTLEDLEKNTEYTAAVFAGIIGQLAEAKNRLPFTTGNTDGKTAYRALLIGEENFTPIATRNRGDVVLMSAMLNSVKGASGNSYSVSACYNQSVSQIRSRIRSVFADADEDDVSLFFIATHGDSSSTGPAAGALSIVNDSGEYEYLLLGDLAGWLSDVPGKVIVFLEACGSGAAVYEDGILENRQRTDEELDQMGLDLASAAIRAFSARDRQLLVKTTYSWSEEDPTVKTGEFRQNKFYVLTASRYLEDSWGTERYQYNFFTYDLTNGVGTSGTMPADDEGDGNGRLTLHELFSYIKKYGDVRTYQGQYHQHVQVYPANSSEVLFIR